MKKIYTWVMVAVMVVGILRVGVSVVEAHTYGENSYDPSYHTHEKYIEECYDPDGTYCGDGTLMDNYVNAKDEYYYEESDDHIVDTQDQGYIEEDYDTYEISELSTRDELIEQLRSLRSWVERLLGRGGSNTNIDNEKDYYYGQNNSSNTDHYYSGSPDFLVQTEGSRLIEGNRSTLVGEIDLNRADATNVYFNWGPASNYLPYETTHIAIHGNQNRTEFSAGLTNLKENTTYYFQAVAEDESGGRVVGRVLSFRTHNSNVNLRDNNAYGTNYNYNHSGY